MNIYILTSFLSASLLSLVLGKYLIPLLTKLKFGQSIRELGPQSHLKKSGTPTMGGFIFLTGFLSAIALTLNFSLETAIFILSTLGMGLVGFLDDYLIIKRSKNDGLSAKHKLLGQIAVAIAVTFLAGHYFGTTVLIPFTDFKWDMGVLYYPFMVFFMVAIANGVNLTDGLDGLAGTVTFFNMGFFSICALSMGMISLSAAGFALCGGLVGFVFYNKYPAKIFMGDLGSLALGGAIAAISMMTGLVLFVPIVGLIYVIETLSVTIQVMVFKKTKKRVFKMAPIHHHFELSGWNEITIVSAFSALTIITALISLLLIF